MIYCNHKSNKIINQYVGFQITAVLFNGANGERKRQKQAKKNGAHFSDYCFLVTWGCLINYSRVFKVYLVLLFPGRRQIVLSVSIIYDLSSP